MLNSHNIRMIAKYDESYRSPKSSYTPLIVLAIVWIVFMAIVSSKAFSAQINTIVVRDWTTEQYVNAIYLAEGGKNASYPYGIRSVSVSSVSEARKVCFNTVRNNKKRFKNLLNTGDQRFIDFLASRYCPVGAGNDSKGLNKNWVKNVTWFLNHPRKA